MLKNGIDSHDLDNYITGHWGQDGSFVTHSHICYHCSVIWDCDDIECRLDYKDFCIQCKKEENDDARL